MLSALALHKSWIVLVGTFFLGETVVLASSALAAQGSWSWQAVAGWAFLGTVVSDTVWFRSIGAGVTRLLDDQGDGKLRSAADRLERLTGEHPHRALLFVKFLYGTRIASISYMALRRVRLRTFVGFDSAGTALWLAVMIPIGWAIGRGLAALGARLRDIELAILILVLAAALVKGAISWKKSRVA